MPLLVALSGCRYVHADERTAFLGDSITQQWAYPRANYGIFGNTTAQMAERLPGIFPGHAYTTVVILGGTNDVLLGVPPDATVANLQQMADYSAAHHAQPVLCEIPPIFHSFNPADRRDFRPQVLELNRRIAALAAAHQWKLVDYYTPLSTQPARISDGVHMKRSGYLVMERALIPVLNSR